MERWKAESEADVASTSESELHLGISVFSRPPSKPPSTLFENEALSANVLRNFATLRQEGRFCDVILIAGSRSKEDVESEGERECGIACHRGVLAAASPYFNAMFTPAMIESKQDRIYLQGIDSETLSALVDYMYTGRLLIDEHNVQNLLTTGSVLQLACVRDACSRFLLEQLDPSNCLGISHFAMIHGCTQLAHAATTFIHQHFSHLIRCEEFLALDKDRLIELISADRLTTNGEEKVYEAVMNWTRHDLPNRKEYIPELMDHVRLALVPQEYLTDKIDTEPLIRQSAECKDFLLEAYRHHLKKDRKCEHKRCAPRQPVPLSKLIMLIGGQAPKAIVNVDVFDVDSIRWTSLSDLPQRRCRCGVGELGDTVYAVGGFNGSLRVRTVDAYDIQRDKWFPSVPMDARRSTLGVTVVEQRMIAIGGFDGTTGLSSAEAFDPREGQWMALPSMSVRRSSVGVSALGGLVYAVGGYDGYMRQCLNTVEIYEPRANRWRTGPTLMSSRSGAGVTVVADKLVAIGGHDGPYVRDTAEILIDDVWNELPNMNICRRNAGVVALGSTLFAIGGDDGTMDLSSIEMLDLSALDDISQTWTQLEVRMNRPRSYAGVALLPKLV
ncbi:unnamed protein product [Toxocara canis]|uniref:BTB domain-containing protein n=1 Tax=Toxocara canis TaxID=6265 RepID=A0A183UTG5_TOXCA|nr:unnamed protein product [Toxocara canis]